MWNVDFSIKITHHFYIHIFRQNDYIYFSTILKFINFSKCYIFFNSIIFYLLIRKSIRKKRYQNSMPESQIFIYISYSQLNIYIYILIYHTYVAFSLKKIKLN